MYLSIPNGMQYKQVNEGGIAVDYFIDPQGIKDRINIQEPLKEALRSNNSRSRKISTEHFTVYLRGTPWTNDFFLGYVPNRNGKFATEKPTKLVKGTEAYRPCFPASRFSYGNYAPFWSHNPLLSQARLEVILAHREEQRENRRHTGDSPCST